MKAEDREPLAQALFDAGYGVGEQVDIDRLKAKLAALGYEVRPIAERERYEALRRYRFATEGIEQAAAEAADREAAGGEPSGERIVDSDRAIPSAAVAPYEHPHVWEVQEVCEGCGDRRAIAPATSSVEVGGSLDVEALRTALDGLDVYAYDRDLHGEPLEINEATHRIAAAYDDAIRKRDPSAPADPTGGGAVSVNCRDPQCPWGSIEHYQHEPDGPIYALMGGPAVLLRDTPQDRERLAAALTSVEWHRWKSERVDDIHTRNLSNAIIAALRGKGNAGFYDDPNAEGNDR